MSISVSPSIAAHCSSAETMISHSCAYSRARLSRPAALSCSARSLRRSESFSSSKKSASAAACSGVKRPVAFAIIKAM